MLRQHRAALLDRGHEAVGRAAVPDPGDQRGNRMVPHLARDLRVDGSVGHDLGIALGHRREDQHSSAAFGIVQAVCEELPHGERMGAGVLGAARHHMKAERRQPKHDGEHEEDRELDDVNH